MIYIIWVYQEVYETVGHTFIQALQVTFGSPKKGVSDGQTYFFLSRIYYKWTNVVQLVGSGDPL